MAERKRRRRSVEPVTIPASATRARRQERDDAAERALGRVAAIGLPLVCLIAAVVVGAQASVGSALLVLAAGTLLGTIVLLWASVRTLTGDAPLPLGLETLGPQGQNAGALSERKRRVLRALKDLETEHAIGKIDDADYEVVVSRYREEAKAVMREMETEVSPVRAEAERMAQAYLAERGLGDQPPPKAPDAPSADARVACVGCGTSNEADATFCKQCGRAMKGIDAHG